MWTARDEASEAVRRGVGIGLLDPLVSPVRYAKGADAPSCDVLVQTVDERSDRDAGIIPVQEVEVDRFYPQTLAAFAEVLGYRRRVDPGNPVRKEGRYALSQD